MKHSLVLTVLIGAIGLASCGGRSVESSVVAQNSAPQVDSQVAAQPTPENVASSIDDRENGEGGRPTKPIDKTEYPKASAQELEANFKRLEEMKECRGCNFAHADLTRADFTAMKLDGAIFYEALLEGASFSFASLNGANLRNAHLYRADLTNSKMADTNLTGAILLEARMNQSSLANADVRGTDFTDAVLSGANIDGWIIDGETRLQGAKLPNY